MRWCNCFSVFSRGLHRCAGADTAKGIDAGTLTSLTGFADELNNTNVTQETFKSNRKISTQAAVTALNNVYGKVMDVR